MSESDKTVEVPEWWLLSLRQFLGDVAGIALKIPDASDLSLVRQEFLQKEVYDRAHDFAYRDIDDFLEESPNDCPTVFGADEAMRFYELGRDAMRRTQLKEAESYFRKSIHCNPHPKTAELLGDCLAQQDIINDAIIYLAAAIGLGTRPATASYLLGKLLYQEGKYVDSYRKVQTAIGFNPDYRAAKELSDMLLQRAEVQAELAREDPRTKA